MWKRFFIFFVAVSFIFAGCGPKKGRIKTVSLPFLDISSFHPAYWQSQHILAQGTIFEGLFGYEPDPKNLGGLKVVPVIAESWKISDDGKVWTIKLRKDKKWSNGDPVTAKDFEWSYKYYCDPELKDIPLWASPLGNLKNAWAVKAGGVPVDQLGVKALDDYTLQLTLADPDYNIHLGLAAGGVVPVHRKSVESNPQDWWKPEKLVCNGPYIVKEWTQGKDCVLVKNTNYVGYCGNVEKIVLKFMVAGLELGIQSFQSKELDFAWINNVGQYNYVLSKPELKAAFHEDISDLMFAGYEIARCLDPALDDIRLREAFAISIDRETLVNKIMGNRAVPGYKIWDDSSPIGKKLKPIKFDVNRAKKLLAEAGYPDGKGLPQLKFYITGASDPVAEYIVNEWKKNINVDVKIENLESGLYWMSVWTTTPKLSAGFMRFGGPMNRFSTGDLTKNASHVLWNFDFPAEFRKLRYEMDFEQRNAIRTSEKGKNRSDWDELLIKSKKLWEERKKIIASEPHRLWKEEMSRKPTFEEQFETIWQNWQNAKNDRDRQMWWRTGAELVLSEEYSQLEYKARSPHHKEMYRANLELMRMPWEKAVANAHKVIQMFQDTYYMVPLYFDKIQYLQNPKLSGVVLYKFSWGPQIFNFKYLNLAD